MTPTIKPFARVEIKNASKGEVEAVVATLGVVDRDGDIILPTAIANGAKVKVSSWGHEAMFGERPVGKGVLSTEGDRLVFKGRLFLNTTDGRETFETLKELGEDTEWSFGFLIRDSRPPNDEERQQGAARILTKLDAFEVSPVMIGAGIGTRTTSVKATAAPPDDPVQAELRRIAENVQQLTIKDIWERHQERTREIEREERAARAAELARIETDTARICAAAQHTIKQLEIAEIVREIKDRHLNPRTNGVDAFAKYEHVIAFACERLGLPPADWPAHVRLVPAFCLPAKATGIYRHRDRLIAIADDLNPDEAEATVLHEVVHCWEKTRGKDLHEDVVRWTEADLFDEWKAVRVRRYPHRYAA